MKVVPTDADCYSAYNNMQHFS